MWLRVIVVALFIAAVASLGRGLYFLLKGSDRSPDLVNSLTARIAFTVLAMLVILSAWLTGTIHSGTPWLN